MAKAISQPDVRQVDVYFPGINEIWYNKYSYQPIKSNGYKNIPVTLNEIPVYIRGGSIVPVRNRIRRAALLTLKDPYTLIVALDINGTASGYLYTDESDDFNYRNGKYLNLKFIYLNNQLISQFTDKGRFETKAWIEKVVIIGIPNLFRRAIIHSDNGSQEELEIKYDTAKHSLSIRKPAVPITEQWTISLL